MDRANSIDGSNSAKSILAIPAHSNVVTVLEYFYDPDTRLLHIVMEHMDQNLYQLIKSRKGAPFSLPVVKSILYVNQDLPRII